MEDKNYLKEILNKINGPDRPKLLIGLAAIAAIGLTLLIIISSHETIARSYSTSDRRI